MNKDILKAAGIGLGVVAVIVALVFLTTRGAQIRLDGEIQMVRVQSMDPDSCVVIVDFRVENPADYAFVVRGVTIHLRNADGVTTTGRLLAQRRHGRHLPHRVAQRLLQVPIRFVHRLR